MTHIYSTESLLKMLPEDDREFGMKAERYGRARAYIELTSKHFDKFLDRLFCETANSGVHRYSVRPTHEGESEITIDEMVEALIRHANPLSQENKLPRHIRNELTEFFRDRIISVVEAEFPQVIFASREAESMKRSQDRCCKIKDELFRVLYSPDNSWYHDSLRDT
jgi:hypothetical protein